MTERLILTTLAKEVAEETQFFTHADCPFPVKVYDGDPRMMVIVGENASGKSLFFRFVASMAQQEHKITPVTLSIRERTGGGSMEMGRMRQMFVYGDEGEQSTGAVSARTVEAGFHNAGRTEMGKSTLLMLDEPEIGLSDGYKRALGELIGQNTRTMNDHCRGVVVVTHSRALAIGLRMGLGEKAHKPVTPTFVFMGPAPKPMDRWMDASEVRTVGDLTGLRDLAGERRKITHRLLSGIKEEKDVEPA